MKFNTLLIAGKEEVGSCVIGTGNKAGKPKVQKGMTKETCYAQCQSGSSYKGCSIGIVEGLYSDMCNIYTEKVVGTDGKSGHTCYFPFTPAPSMLYQS